MGYERWVDLHLDGRFSGAHVHVQNAKLQWGKFYAHGNKDHEISPEDVNKTVIRDNPSSPRSDVDIYSCGREDTTSGTEGSFDLIDKPSGTLICSLQWNCPHESSPGNANSVKAQDRNDGYIVVIGSYPEKGALGKVGVHWETAIM